jgi:ABC-2 type transport system ATP-binding protein
VTRVGDAVLGCRALRKRFGELEAVRGISFNVGEEETYGLLGPNGAGTSPSPSSAPGSPS